MHKCNLPIPPAAPYGTWICRKCNLVFRTRAERQKHKKEVHPNDKAWNQGLTTETSEDVKRNIEKLREGYKSGRLKYKPLSKEAREKLSKAVSSYLESIEYKTHGYVKRYPCKNISGKEYSCQGSWEFNVAKRLNDLNILWERGSHISYIKDGVAKTYTPDFYLPATNEYIEVKGKYGPNDKVKMRLVSEQHPDLKILFIDQWHYADFIAGKLTVSQNDLQLWY